MKGRAARGLIIPCPTGFFLQPSKRNATSDSVFSAGLSAVDRVTRKGGGHQNGQAHRAVRPPSRRQRDLPRSRRAASYRRRHLRRPPAQPPVHHRHHLALRRLRRRHRRPAAVGGAFRACGRGCWSRPGRAARWPCRRRWDRAVAVAADRAGGGVAPADRRPSRRPRCRPPRTSWKTRSNRSSG